MKSSYYTTPRTMQDATWHSWGEAMDLIPTHSGSRIGIVVSVIAAALVFALILVSQ